MACKNNKLLEDVHPLTIIREVKKWPVLYSIDNRAHGNNGYFKRKVWYEVAKSLFTDFDSYTETEKESKVIDLSKKWRNLRDTFKRQVEVEKKVREGKEIKKKPYVYFEHMLFLLPHVTSMEDTNIINPKLEKYFEKEKILKEKDRSSNRKIKQRIISETPMNEKRITKRKIEQHFIDETPISIPRLSLKTCETDEIDEDRHFALSLIPTLKKMSDDEKLIAKMEILKALRNVRSQSTTEKAEDVMYCVEEVGSSTPVKIEFFEEEATEEVTNVSEDSDDTE